MPASWHPSKPATEVKAWRHGMLRTSSSPTVATLIEDKLEESKRGVNVERSGLGRSAGSCDELAAARSFANRALRVREEPKTKVFSICNCMRSVENCERNELSDTVSIPARQVKVCRHQPESTRFWVETGRGIRYYGSGLTMIEKERGKEIKTESL